MTIPRFRAIAIALAVIAVLAGRDWNPPSVEAAGPFVVTTTADTTDGVCDSHCTLREAITAANANANPLETDTITFAIPGPGPHLIQPGSLLPTITQSLEIDGTSQPGAQCSGAGHSLKIQVDGGGALTNALNFQSATAIVRGMSITDFVGDAVLVVGGGGHEFRCNHFGLGPGGEEADANDTSLAIINATSGNIGGPNPAYRNVTAGGTTGFRLNTSSNLVVYGNYVGTGANGMTAQPGTYGIYGGSISDSSILANVIVASLTAVSLGGSQSGLVIESNIINYAADGTTPIGTGTSTGIVLFVFSSNTSSDLKVGGTNPGEGNRIRAGSYGVALSAENPGSLTGATVRGNEIKMMSGRGISLLISGSPSTTIPNDPMDADTAGPNLLQNFPVLSNATTGVGVQGSLNSVPSSQFKIDFYASTTCTPRSAERYLGSVNAATDGNGDVTFNANSLGAFSTGEAITATATDAAGNTSELSVCKIAAVPVPTIQSVSPAGAVAGSDSLVVTLTGSHFTPSTQVTWGNTTTPSTFQDSSTITLTVTAEMIGDTQAVASIGLVGTMESVVFDIWRSSSDVDCDGTAEADDALVLMQLLVGTVSETSCPGDANKSGGPPNILDVLHIRRELADLLQPLKSTDQGAS